MRLLILMFIIRNFKFDVAAIICHHVRFDTGILNGMTEIKAKEKILSKTSLFTTRIMGVLNLNLNFIDFLVLLPLTLRILSYNFRNSKWIKQVKLCT